MLYHMLYQIYCSLSLQTSTMIFVIDWLLTRSLDHEVCDHTHGTEQ